MSAFTATHLDEIEEASDGRCPWRPIRHHFDIKSFGVNAWTAREAGDRIINEHREVDDEGNEEQEELYLVHTGRARFELDGESLDAPAGTFVYAVPSVKRTAFAEEAGTTIIALGGTPGRAFEVGGWEVWRPFQDLYEAGEYEGVADRGRAEIEASGLSMPLYNLACCESLAGRKTDAIEHVRLALASTEQYRDRLRSLASKDSDLDPLRDEPAFRELVEQQA